MSTSIGTNIKAALSNDDLTQQIETLRADVARLMGTVSDDVSAGIDKAGRQITQTSREARASATGMVIDNPLAAVGIAVGAGLLLGMIVRKG